MHGECAIARELRLEDVRDGTRTQLEILEVKLDPAIHDRKFYPVDLDSGGE